jgi:low temperature requirement protein LtrA
MEEKKVSWLELFFDLVFVTAVSYTTHLFVGIEGEPEHLRAYFGEYLLMVFPMFWLWSGQSMFLNRFGQHLRRPELFMFPQMFFLILMTASFDFTFSHTYHAYLFSYLGLRLLTVLEYHLIRGGLAAQRRHVAALLGRLFIPGLLLPLFSLFFSEERRYAVMYGGIALDMILPWLFRRTLATAPVHFGHLSERLGLFVMITFGESLVSVAAILSGHLADPGRLLFAGLCFLLICLLWLSYFYAHEHVMDHGLRTNGQLMLYGHFFILTAIMLMAGDIEFMVEEALPGAALTAFLYGPALLFFAATNLVFFRHRKRDRPYSLRAVFLVFLLLAAGWLLSSLAAAPPTAVLASLAAIYAVANLIQTRR